MSEEKKNFDICCPRCNKPIVYEMLCPKCAYDSDLRDKAALAAWQELHAVALPRLLAIQDIADLGPSLFEKEKHEKE